MITWKKLGKKWDDVEDRARAEGALADQRIGWRVQQHRRGGLRGSGKTASAALTRSRPIMQSLANQRCRSNIFAFQLPSLGSTGGLPADGADERGGLSGGSTSCHGRLEEDRALLFLTTVVDSDLTTQSGKVSGDAPAPTARASP